MTLMNQKNIQQGEKLHFQYENTAWYQFKW